MRRGFLGKGLIVGDTKHPADEIDRALGRAGALLSALTNGYDKDAGQFDVGHNFVFEAISNVERMLTAANEALGALYEGYDLRPVGTAEAEALLAAQANLAANMGTETQLASGPGTQGILGAFNASSVGALGALDSAIGPSDPSAPFIDFMNSPEPVSRLSDRLDAILERFPREEPTVEKEEPPTPAASTYAEFLDKLTAMANAAASEAKRAGKQDTLLAPVLESLQADVKRLRSVA